MSNVVGTVIILAVALYIIAYVGLPAFNAIANGNTTGIDSGVATLVTTVVSVIGALAIIILILRSAGIKF